MRNPHEVLGLGPNANQDEIKAAYRKLVKQYHPDINQDENAPEKFREISEAYDSLTKKSEPFQDRFQRDLFEQMMRMRQEQYVREQNCDVQTMVEISLEQAFFGCDINITLRQIPGMPTHQIHIPAGVAHANRIRVTGGGVQRNPNYPAGDLYVVVQIAPHDTLWRAGDDLLTKVEINSFEAILGKTMDVMGIDGPTRIEIPPCVQHGAQIVGFGQGMPSLHGTIRGNLVAEIVVRTPVIGEEHRDLIKKIESLLPNPTDAM